MPGRQHEPARETGSRPAAGSAQCGCDRSRVPCHQRWRLRSGANHRFGNQGPSHLRAGSMRSQGHRCRRRRRQTRRRSWHGFMSFWPRPKFTANIKLKKAEEEIVRLAIEGVKRAKALAKDVEFSPEDASRTEPEFLAQRRRGGHRGRRHHGEHPRHRGLGRARAIRRPDHLSA